MHITHQFLYLLSKNVFLIGKTQISNHNQKYSKSTNSIHVFYHNVKVMKQKKRKASLQNIRGQPPPPAPSLFVGGHGITFDSEESE